MAKMKKVVLYDICGRPISRPALINVKMHRERRIGGHILMLSEYDDPNDDSHFFGVSFDCVVQRRGTREECEQYWRCAVRALNERKRRADVRAREDAT